MHAPTMRAQTYGLLDTKKKKKSKGNRLVSSEREINAFQFKPPAGGPVPEPWP